VVFLLRTSYFYSLPSFQKRLHDTMYFSWLSKRYYRINTEEFDNVSAPKKESKLPIMIFGLIGFFLTSLGFLAGLFVSHKLPRLGINCETHLVDTAPQGLHEYDVADDWELTHLVSLESTSQIFRYNESFGAHPPASGGTEPIWDAQLPSKYGSFVSPYSVINYMVL
jgi:hypothetical protein